MATISRRAKIRGVELARLSVVFVFQMNFSKSRQTYLFPKLNLYTFALCTWITSSGNYLSSAACALLA
jgi:hypothetical protein